MLKGEWEGGHRYQFHWKLDRDMLGGPPSCNSGSLIVTITGWGVHLRDMDLIENAPALHPLFV